MADLNPPEASFNSRSMNATIMWALRHSAGCRFKGPSFGRETQDLGVVIEHLFKMRNVPALVDAVPGIPATDVIVDATAFHRQQGVHAVQHAFVGPFLAKHATRPQAQGQPQLGGKGEFRRPKRSAVLPIPRGLPSIQSGQEMMSYTSNRLASRPKLTPDTRSWSMAFTAFESCSA